MRVLMGSLAGLGLAGTLVGCSASPPAPRNPLPTPTPFKSGLDATPTNLAPVPSFCAGPRAVPARAAVPRHLSSVFADGIGAGPVYAVGLMDSATISLENDHAVAQGWPAKELWVIDPRYTGPITLSGHNLVTGAPVWFSLEGPTSTHPKLKGSPPGAGPSGIWTQDPSYVVFPRAGCYTVSARWSTGSWQVTEAVGYGPAVALGAPGPEVSQAKARRSLLAVDDLRAHATRILSATVETLGEANAAGGVQLSTRSNPANELVWMFWLKGRDDEGSCIVAPPALGPPIPVTACSLTSQVAGGRR